MCSLPIHTIMSVRVFYLLFVCFCACFCLKQGKEIETEKQEQKRRGNKGRKKRNAKKRERKKVNPYLEQVAGLPKSPPSQYAGDN